ncbi:MAG: CSLREA domain-containing protein [Chloroflexi bacterium]|nr:CSLREA domain-containing protein [Chloroflexota bacterium]
MAATTLLLSVFVLSLFIANSPAHAARPVRPTPTPAVCDLIPELRDVTINQGVGAYSPLVRGKETLVRAYLSKPACASSTDIIELVGATLTVTPGSAASTTIANPTPVPTTPYPQIASSSAAALADSTADPMFVVPGSVLAPAATVDRFTATFAFTIRYQTATGGVQERTFTSKTGSSTPITATVEKRTNALRVLVVPMGDATRPFAETYTTAGDAALQAAMLTVSRIYPVPDGVGPLTGTTGGLRYSVSSGMLDLSGLAGADGRFCGTGGSSGNFNAIKASLGQFLQSWNAANGSTNQADRVLGVVDAAYSNGSAQGCAEGMAAINSTEAWIRAVPETEGTPSQSGLVAALELGHTFGLVPDSRSDLFSRYHSPNPFADPLRQNRSYNTRLRTLLYEDRTAMTYISAANNNNTLLEQPDWAYLICKLGGAATSDCSAPPVPVGSGAGVAAGPRFVISGTTDGTAAGTDVLESFFSADMLPTTPDSDSPYRLRYVDGGTVIGDIGVPSTDEDSAHDHDDGGDPHHEPGISLFSGAFEFETAADRIELWNTEPATDVLLYARDRNAVPVLDELTVVGGADADPVNYSNDDTRFDVDPAIRHDGRWVAWSAYVFTEGPPSPELKVAPVGDATAAAILDDGEVSIPAWQPAWCSDGAQLAYATPDGDLYIVGVDTSEVPATFGEPVQLYNGDILEGLPTASHPTWSPDCTQLAFEAGSDIWRIDADGTNRVALTSDDRSHDPSWSPDPEDNRIAFERDADTAFAETTYASFVDPDAAGPAAGLSSRQPLSFAVGAHRHASAVRAALRAVVSPAPDAPAPFVAALVIDSTFTVNSNNDVDSGSCDVEHCSLREAILAANATPEADAIEFAIGTGPQTISLSSALPDIIYPVEIDGETQLGFGGDPLIRIDSGEANTGLRFLSTATASEARGLLVTGFLTNGVEIEANDVILEGSWIGLDHGGTGAGNGESGVVVEALSATLAGNVISANGGDGVLVYADNLVLSGNRIGTDPTGAEDRGNGGDGVRIWADDAIIGGAGEPWSGNVISGNDGDGIEITNGGEGESLNHRIYGNLIGLNAAGDAALPNDGHGVNLMGASETYVGMIGYGGDDPAPNTISGNGMSGIYLSSPDYDLQFHGNFIGTDATGTTAIGNAESGIFVMATQDVEIGAGDAETRNVISGNDVGITLRNTDGAARVLGNYIGTNATGDAAVPNRVGILVYGAESETIGGRFDGDGNVVSGNIDDGIQISGITEVEDYAVFNEVIGNLIGTDASGSAALPNGGDGVEIGYAADNNVVGGDTDARPGSGNVISGNLGNGVHIVLGHGNVVQGNFIGTDGGTTELGNGLAGVRVTGPSQGNQIGAELSEGVFGPGNVIAHNGGNGVEILQADSEPPMNFDADFTSVFSNDIWDNGGLGIDLEADGVTPNDAGDDDDASNDLKNFPDEVVGTSDGSQTSVSITTTTSAPAELIIYQLFASDSCDPSDHGEGQRYLATYEAAADGEGFASIDATILEDLEGQFLTATTSDNQGQTSEFSACAEVTFDAGSSATEIHLLEPIEGGTTEYLADGQEPAWGSEGVLYALGGRIRSIQPDGSGDAQLTTGPSHFSPASGGGVIGFAGWTNGEVEDIEVFLLLGQQTVTVRASDDNPQDLRLDLYYACGGQVMPIAVGLLPDQTSASTANFQFNFDATLSCSGGEILAALSDGFSRSVTPPGQGEPVASDKKPPVAATYGPPLGSTYLTSDVIAFHGGGEDPDDGTLTGDSLEWFIRPAGDPAPGTFVDVGEQVDYDASQLDPGDYVVTLVVTDSDGETDSAESLIHVLADSDNDGFSDVDEQTTCLGPGAVTDGSTPSADADSDGIPNGSDPEPCVRAPATADAAADFDPEDFSLSSKGTWVTIYVTTSDRNIREIDPSSVRIVEIAGTTVNIRNDGISFKGDRLVAKFRRSTLTDYFTSNGLTSGNVPITVRGTSNTLPSWSFEASDTTNVIP